MFSILLAQVICGRFAVLIAGSTGWGNYRHQADIFTIYGQLIERGFKEDHITLIAYDDHAFNDENPYKGKIFHKATHDKNVYPGTDKINIKGDEITDQRFYEVITKEIKSTAEDYLFIYYDNHGGAGVLGMPNDDHMFADDVENAVKQMNANGKFKYCLFGIEACFSGSIACRFTDKNLCSITAAGPDERSAATEWDSDLIISLSDEMTFAWIDLVDTQPKITLGEFYENLKSQVTLSHVHWYGDESMKSMTIDNFFGTTNKVSTRAPRNKGIPVRNEIATLTSLLGRQNHKDPVVRARARLELHNLQTLSKKMDIVLEEVIKIVDAKNIDKYWTYKCGPITDDYLKVLRHFISKFGKYNADDMSKFSYLNNLANAHPAEKIIQAIDQVI